MAHGLGIKYKGRAKGYIGSRTYVASEGSFRVITRAGKTYHLVLWREHESQARELAKDMMFAQPGYSTIIRPIKFQLMDMAIDHHVTLYGIYARKK